MATLEGTPRKFSQLSACNTPNSSNDYVSGIINGGANTGKILIDTLLNSTGANMTGNVITGTQLIATDNTTPANSADVAVQGRIWYDDTYLYVAISNTVIKRITLESF
jgi:hypothetical protein